MLVIVVEQNPELGQLWAAHLGRSGMDAHLVGSADEAILFMHDRAPAAVVVDLDLPGESAMAVADYAAYRHPEARVIFVTASTFFSDGSIFSMSPNAAAFLPTRVPPEDLAAVVEFHARRSVAKS